MVMLGAPFGVQLDHRDSLSFLEQAHYVSSTINVRLAARTALAYEARRRRPAQPGREQAEFDVVKGAKQFGIRMPTINSQRWCRKTAMAKCPDRTSRARPIRFAAAENWIQNRIQLTPVTPNMPMGRRSSRMQNQ